MVPSGAWSLAYKMLIQTDCIISCKYLQKKKLPKQVIYMKKKKATQTKIKGENVNPSGERLRPE